MTTLRIIAWNIAEGRHGGDAAQALTLSRIARLLHDSAADVVLLNEVCIWDPWHMNGVNQVTAIAQAGGFAHVRWERTATMPLRGLKCVAVLSRHPLLSAQRIEHSAYADGGGYATLHVTARIDGQPHHFFSTRITAYDGAEHARSCGQLRDAIAAIPGHEFVAVGGDLNTGYDRWDASGEPTRNHVPLQFGQLLIGARLGHVLGGMGWAMPSPDDHILIRGPYGVVRAERRAPAAAHPAVSDHDWVMAELATLAHVPAPPRPGATADPAPWLSLLLG